MSFQDQPKLNPNNCPSSHGASGFLFGTTYDASTGSYTCLCGRQYFSAIKRPGEVEEVRSFHRDDPMFQDTRPQIQVSQPS